ncbi:MAG: sigma-54 dependent transcriptional regulator [Candidatus Latescibacterota bacterium]
MHARSGFVPLVRQHEEVPVRSPGGSGGSIGSAVEAAPVITRSPGMLAVLAQVEELATTSATVLIQGESGTGKGMVARALHARSPRRRSPFVDLNCAALPEGLLESELFGHEKGAFTGAAERRLGRFELAEGGTLFLDEIGAADPRVQMRLLRVLQEREFERVGGSRTLAVDVRIVAATNADLREEVRKGAFREDLYYRLSVVPIHLPPLRERREDIPALVTHFVTQAALRNGRPVRQVDEEALARLQAYPWPGNVRQLENVVERMVILGRQPSLTVADIPEEIAEWRCEAAPSDLDLCSYQQARILFERRFLCAALRRHHGVISQVAEAIGMSRKNLYMKLEHLQIDYERYRS